MLSSIFSTGGGDRQDLFPLLRERDEVSCSLCTAEFVAPRRTLARWYQPVGLRGRVYDYNKAQVPASK